MRQVQRDDDGTNSSVDLAPVVDARGWLITERQALAEELTALRATLREFTNDVAETMSDLHDLRAGRPEPTTSATALTGIAGTPLPVYLTAELQPRANPRVGVTPERVLICSIPKAGTYLYSRALELLGLEPTHLHLSMTHFGDYRFTSAANARNERKEVRVDMPIKQSLPLVGPGQFAVGHLECSWETVDLFSPFKILFLYRNLRDAVVSHMRWVASGAWGTAKTDGWRSMRDTPAKMLSYFNDIGTFFFDARCHPVVGWFNRPEVLSLSFEQIYGDFGPEQQMVTLRKIMDFCGVENQPGLEEKILEKLIGSATNTWSGRRTKWQDFWNEKIEEKFSAFGGKDLNRRLGYEE